MSYMNLKLKVWSRGDDVRVYVDGSYVERNDEYAACRGYLKATADGSVSWGSHDKLFGEAAEDRGHAMEALIEGLNCATFSELLERFEQCRTPKGAVSLRQYAKKFEPGLLPA